MNSAGSAKTASSLRYATAKSDAEASKKQSVTFEQGAKTDQGSGETQVYNATVSEHPSTWVQETGAKTGE
jgi:hypothetical protein